MKNTDNLKSAVDFYNKWVLLLPVSEQDEARWIRRLERSLRQIQANLYTTLQKHERIALKKAKSKIKVMLCKAKKDYKMMGKERREKALSESAERFGIKTSTLRKIIKL